MAAKDIHTDIYFKKFPNATTLNVTLHLTKEYKIRVWIAVRLLRLISWILGTEIKIDRD